MGDLMEHNLSFDKESIRQYTFQPLLKDEDLVKSFARHTLGRLPRKQKKDLKKELKKRYGYDFKAIKKRVAIVQSLKEISARYKPNNIKQGIKNS